ncbi:Intracellular proteinase inhibitor [Marininema mesophilum]|uniref:Intracellular proteinase inhibitor n=1 Tax=Marininema mesophilum TaxID=1048340 RepID=A0A1H3A329_9BACL|nr:BsuPI-related putative proteinase inhibitor [Marininema mesophilum]SDX24172.1 Intracellular proteinase inhibitor [Marininema mesophilum]
MKEYQWITWWSGGLLITVLILIWGGYFNKKEAPSHQFHPVQLDLGLQVKETRGVTQFQWGIVNGGKEQTKLIFGSGQRTKLTVTDPNGNIVYRWPTPSSKDKGESILLLKPGDHLRWSAEWEPSLKSRAVKAGKYTVTVEVLLAEVNGQSVEKGLLRKQKSWTFQ